MSAIERARAEREKWQIAFLNALVAGSSAEQALNAARVSMQHVSQSARQDADFAEAYRLALIDGERVRLAAVTDTLARRQARALHGA